MEGIGKQRGAGSPAFGGVELQPGDLFASRYRVERLLGRGANGAVWAARDEAVGDPVALKILVAGPDDAVERFRREVRLARRVTHRNAARIFDLGHQERTLFLTMELVEGRSLADLLRRGPLEIGRACEIASQIATGLAAAHEVGIVHRDVKPANVLIEDSGRVVVTDFGVARAVSGDPQVTRGAAMIGSPSYMAPEQVRGEEVGPSADLYALGCLLYEALSGQCPFVRESAVSTALARLQDEPTDIETLVAVPKRLADLLRQLLQRDPSDRPPDANEVANELQVFAESAASERSGQDYAETLVAGTESPVSRRSPTRATPSSDAFSTSSSTSSSTTTASRSAAQTFITIAPHDRTLAVLPFQHRGAPETAYVSETLSEDVIDTLTTTRGLRVKSYGATAKYAGQGIDPRQAGEELGVDAIVDSSVRVTGPAGGESLRIVCRLVDTATGEQLWTGRIAAQLHAADDELEVLAQRIAESLRLELEVLSARHGVPEQAVTLLLEARQRAEIPSIGDDHLEQALALLERALEIAPEMPLALATHAALAVRRWFLPSDRADGEIPRRAHESVERACERAAHIPLTHFAAARLAVYDGQFGDAANHLTLALQMAPTFAVVHDYLGMLQCEAGRGADGERHLRLARRIDPKLPPGQPLARRLALAGRMEEYQAALEELKATPEASRFMIDSLELRVAGWHRDLETVRRCDPAQYLPTGHGFRVYVDQQRRALLGEGTADELIAAMEQALSTGAGPRLDAFIHQLAAEALVPLGDLERAMEQLDIATRAPAMLDADWMEHCPALDALRERPEFREMAARVRRRADAIWRLQTG